MVMMARVEWMLSVTVDDSDGRAEWMLSVTVDDSAGKG